MAEDSGQDMVGRSLSVELVSMCYVTFNSPFLFPFECRQTLFYLTTFDRDRAISRLQVSFSSLNSCAGAWYSCVQVV